MITILGIFIALILPAVQSSREAGRRIQCANNIKQLSLSSLAYHDSLGNFPAAMTVPTKGRLKDMDPADTLKWGPNWIIRILPFCEASNVYKQFNLSKPISDPANAAARATRIPTMLCPTDAYNSKPYNPVHHKAEGENWARGNYGANGAIEYLSGMSPFAKGYPNNMKKNPFFFLGPGSVGWNATGGTQAGAFAISRGVMGCNESCTIAQITDGTSNTVMLAELRAGVSPVDRRGTWAMGAAGASSLWGHGAYDDHGPNADTISADDIKDDDEIIATAGSDIILQAQRWGSVRSDSRAHRPPRGACTSLA